MKYQYKTQYTCSQLIDFELNGNIVTNISFYGGCNGNLKAISKLVDGWTVEKIEEYLRGNTCGRRPTSCADQLAIAVREAYDSLNAQAETNAEINQDTRSAESAE